MGRTFNHHQSEKCSDRTGLYAEVTDRIITGLEAGRVPWVQPWDAGNAPLGLPANALTGRRYAGINILILWDSVAYSGLPQSVHIPKSAPENPPVRCSVHRARDRGQWRSQWLRRLISCQVTTG